MPFLRRYATLAFAIGAAGLLACSGLDRETTTSATQAEEQADASSPGDAPCDTVDGVPTDLRCAGLYSDWATRTVAPEALEFKPGFELWSDGARKSRWVVLPPGTKIDVRDMNNWVFPVGTKFFKEFRFVVGGKERRIETRLLWKRGENSWVATKYVWSKSEDSAVREIDAVSPLEGSSYQVPSDGMCNMCHRGGKDQALGFSAVLLAAPEAEGVTYAELLARGLLAGAPATDASSEAAPLPDPAALQIPGEPTAREALGRLHVGCGLSCHNAKAYRPFQMRVDVVDGHTPARVEDTLVFKTGVGRPAMTGGFRIQAGDPDSSAVIARMRVRGSGQMPPVGTNVVDDVSLAAVTRWIKEVAPSPYP